MERLPQKGCAMTEDKKHDDNDRKKLSDEELEDVDAGYAGAGMGSHFPRAPKGKKKDEGDGKLDYAERKAGK